MTRGSGRTVKEKIPVNVLNGVVAREEVGAARVVVGVVCVVATMLLKELPSPVTVSVCSVCVGMLVSPLALGGGG